MCVLVYKPDILFSVSSHSRRLIRSGSTPLLSKVSRLLPTEDCDRMCVRVEVVCAWEGVFNLEEIEYIYLDYKTINHFICMYLILIIR